jgi:hypothetical protein
MESHMKTEIQTHEGRPNGGGANGTLQGSAPAGASPLRRRKIRVEVEVPEGLMGEFDLMVHEVLVGKRARLDALEQEFKAIETRALAGPGFLLATIRASAGGQSGRLVRFLASLYLKYDYPFDLSDLRTLDTALANACLDYLNYDRLGVCDVDRHLPDGGRGLEGWIRDYNIVPIDRE